MSFFDDASLAFLPSGAAGKDGKAYSIKPTDGTGDFTFSRGSNLSATRVGADGLIEKGRENLFTYSNDFTNAAWTKFGSPILTSGQSGYDGSSDAWLYESTTISHSILQFVSGSGVYSLSVYAKAGTADGIRLRFSASTDSNIYVDLTDGSIITNQSGISYNIESVGSGWYRVSITSNVSSLSNVRFSVVNNAGAGTDSGNIYIQDAQLEIGLAATDYIESGATTGKAGLLEDEPRFDYSGGATCPSLLLEPSRTNLVPSEYFGAWGAYSAGTGSNPIITSNYAISPDGNLNATRIQFNRGSGTTSGDTSYITYGLSAGTIAAALSVYLKTNDGTTKDVTLRLGASIFDYNVSVTSEWKRFTLSGSTSVDRMQILLYGSENDQTADLSCFGAQVEAGSYATSYIPNHSGGSVTRGADSCLGSQDSSLFNDSSMSLFLDLPATNQETAIKEITISDGTTNNRFNVYSVTSNQLRTSLVSGGAVILNYVVSDILTNQHLKICITYSGNTYKVFVNGALKLNVTMSTPPVGLNNLNFANSAGSSLFYGEVKQAAVFNEALSDADCITLTTI